MVELVAAFVAGILAGGAALTLLASRQWDKTFRQMNCIAFIGQLDVVRRIEAGHSEELVDQIVESLPDHVTAIANEVAADCSTRDALYAARRFYETTGRDVPEGIRQIVDAVPQRKVVCYRVQSLCSTDVKCARILTTLRPVSNDRHPRGWEKGETLCGVKKGWIFHEACGAPLTIGSCV